MKTMQREALQAGVFNEEQNVENKQHQKQETCNNCFGSKQHNTILRQMKIGCHD